MKLPVAAREPGPPEPRPSHPSPAALGSPAAPATCSHAHSRCCPGFRSQKRIESCKNPPTSYANQSDKSPAAPQTCSHAHSRCCPGFGDARAPKLPFFQHPPGCSNPRSKVSSRDLPPCPADERQGQPQACGSTGGLSKSCRHQSAEGSTLATTRNLVPLAHASGKARLAGHHTGPSKRR